MNTPLQLLEERNLIHGNVFHNDRLLPIEVFEAVEFHLTWFDIRPGCTCFNPESILR